MVSTQRRSRSGRSDVASRSLIARIPVSGVRTSWAKTASAVSTTPAAAADLRADLRGDLRGDSRALAPAARFLAGRFFSGRFGRSRRFPAAMILQAPEPLSPWHGRAMGVTDA